MNTPIVPISDFIRKFGMYADMLSKTDAIILTRDGRPFATLKASPEEKNRKLLSLAGSLKGVKITLPKRKNKQRVPLVL